MLSIRLQLKQILTVGICASFLGATGSPLSSVATDAYNQFDPVGHDVVLFGRDSLSGVAPGPIQPLSVVPVERDHVRDGDDEEDQRFREDDDAKTELRTYQVFDLAGNPLLLVERVKKSRHHLSVRIISVQSGQAAAITLPGNSQEFEWTLQEDGSLKDLNQEFRVGRGSESPRVDADFDAKPNQTVIRQEEPEPKTRTVRQGLDLLRMATSTGKLSIEF